MTLDETLFLQSINHGGGCTCAQTSEQGQLSYAHRIIQHHHIEAFHVSRVDSQNVSYRLMKEHGVTAVFSGFSYNLRC